MKPGEKLGEPVSSPAHLERKYSALWLAEFDALADEIRAYAKGKAKTQDKKGDEPESFTVLRGFVRFVAKAAGGLIKEVEGYNRRRMGKALGVQVKAIDDKTTARFARESAQELNKFAVGAAESLDGLLVQAAKRGLRAEAFAGELERRLAVQRKKAVRLAVAQVTRTNAKITEHRHAELGITEYIWQAVGGRQGDGHTRPWHAKLHGQRIRYDSPPVGGGGGPKDRGHAGSADVCRCQQIPVIPQR